ncbi:MAG: carbohydrate kinase [Chloroflexaceae bacterium]|nr:carbohydrate kinase [Chloroflexaceae bacterium]
MDTMIACLGEILVDFLPNEEQSRTSGFEMHPGGSPFNVAVGLARQQQPVAFVGKISNDFFGHYLRSSIEYYGIDARFIASAEAPSTLAFVTTRGGEPVYTFYDSGAADTLLTIDDIPDAFFQETKLLHFGSISLLRGSTPDTVLEVVQRLQGHALLSFDPNIRPSLVHEETAYRDRLQRLFQCADIVKMSAVDVAWLAPGQSVETFASHLINQGPSLIMVTQGRQPVLAIYRTTGGAVESIRLPSFQIDVKDTVGAGDAFCSGLLAWLTRRQIMTQAALQQLSTDQLEQVLRYATANAALTCMRPGANPPSYEELTAFLASH